MTAMSKHLDDIWGFYQPARTGHGPCICDVNPETTEGPDIECPIHGIDAQPETETTPARTYICARCGATRPDDGFQPEGWAHMMDGRDLCDNCRTDV